MSISGAQRRPRGLSFLALTLGLMSCREKVEPRGEKPPEVSVTAQCLTETATLPPELPRAVGEYCVDAHSDVRSYGVGTGSGLDAICTELFNGECEIYKRYGLDRVHTFSYVLRTDSTKRVAIVMSTFQRGSGAYGFFGRRIVGDGLPSQVTAEVLPGSERAALGAGVGYLLKGRSVVEMTYLSEKDTPELLEAEAKKLLPRVIGALAVSIPAADELPREAALLEKLGAVPFGVSLRDEPLLGKEKLGHYALGIFSAPARAHRIFIASEKDEKRAIDGLGALVGYHIDRDKIISRPLRVRRVQDEQAPETWTLGREGHVLFGVGPMPDTREGESFDDFADARLKAVRAAVRAAFFSSAP